jgi:putative ABC transport system permease protein
MLETLWQDFRFGARMLMRKPGFTTVAVLTLALGIGANTAIFSVINGVLLRPLPYSEPDRIATVWNTYLQLGIPKTTVSPVDFRDWQQMNRSFAHMASYAYSSFVLTGDHDPVRLLAARVTSDFFAVMGVEPMLGQTFVAEDDQPEAGKVAVLSHGLWQRQFGADPGIVGQSVTLDGTTYEVRGVMPPEFGFPSGRDLWAPQAYPSARFELRQRGSVYLQAVARLKPGIAVAEAQAEMAAIARQLEQLYPETNQGRNVLVLSLHDDTVGEVRLALWVLLGAVGFVLLIACANVANLLLARTATRQNEVAVRVALGAGRARLIRQFLTESVLLGLSGAVAGLLFALWGLDLLRTLGAGNLPRLEEVRLDMGVLGFTIGVALVSAFLFGLAPAFFASRADLNSSLREGGRGAGESFRRNPLRAVLVVGEVALALVLLVGASLLVQSFLRLQSVDTGFNPESILTTYVSLPPRYADGEAQSLFFRQLTDRLTTRPEIESAGVSTTVPLQGSEMALDFLIQGRPLPVRGQEPGARFNSVTPGYFRALGMRLQAGRFFLETDRADAPPVAVINRDMAERFWPGENPIGEKITINVNYENPDPVYHEIVGIVEGVRHNGLDEESGPEMFAPRDQYPMAGGFLVVRSAQNPETLSSIVRSELFTLDDKIAPSSFRSMGYYLSSAVAQPRFRTVLLSLFALLALVLASVGVYGVISYSVAQRTNEIGIRMAMGAQQADVFQLVVGQGMLLALAGLGLGLVVSFVLTRFLANLLYGVSATDPVTFVGVSVVLGAVALLACYIPARRATRVDPMVALRYE